MSRPVERSPIYLVATLAMLAGVATLSSCNAFFFSGVPETDRSRPVARIQLVGHPDKFGATTDQGIVFLNEEEVSGPCRVHYFLGPYLLVEDGTVRKFGGVYHLAEIDLKTQSVPVMTRELTREDVLVALVLVGREVESVSVALANDPDVSGYALAWPGRSIPPGTPIFHERERGGLQFVGLANQEVTLTGTVGTRRFITFTGPARMREAMATPKPMFRKREVKYRPDGMTVVK